MATSQVPQLPAEPHVALVRCQTNYLGAAAPSDVRDGLEAVQKPLAELVCAAGRVLGPPFDAVLTAYTSGVSLEAPANANYPVFISKWWPISDLLECGAFRWDGVLFQPVKYKSTVPVVGGQPTLFAMTFRRRDIPASDCWAFVTKTEEAAIALTTAVKLAHLNRLGWGSSPTDRPPALNLDPVPSTNAQRSVPTGSSMFQASCGRSQSSCWNATVDNDCGTFINSKLGNIGQIYNEFNEKPPLQGYFYTPNSSLIKTYSIASEQPCCTSNDAAPMQQLLSASTEPKVSGLPLITGPFGPNYKNLDRYYGEQTAAAGVQADVAGPRTSWPLVHDAPPQLPQPQQPQLQAVPAPFVEYPVPVAYPEYFPAYPPPIPPQVYQPDETVEFVSRVVKKKHHKQPGYYYYDDDDTISVGRNNERYVLVPEQALQVRRNDKAKRRDDDPAGPDPSLPNYMPISQPDGSGPPPVGSRMHQWPQLMVDPYADEGPYERRLPIGGPMAAGRMMAAYGDPYYDPDMMYGSNFILKPADGMAMRLA